MTRLKDFYNKEIQNLTDCWTLPIIPEAYCNWLERIGVTEADDDKGFYGDEEPTWYDTPPEADPEEN